MTNDDVEPARHRLAVANRVDELEELRDSLAGRSPLLAGMLGPLYVYGGIFLLATGAAVFVLAVVEPATGAVRLVGAVLLCGVGWLAVAEGRELRRTVPGTRERMIELEDELEELRARGPWGRSGR